MEPDFADEVVDGTGEGTLEKDTFDEEDEMYNGDGGVGGAPSVDGPRPCCMLVTIVCCVGGGTIGVDRFEVPVEEELLGESGKMCCCI